MAKTHSLKKRAEFLALNEGGKKISTACCLILYKESDLKCCRLGITVSKKISKKAVIRNKARRRLREIFKKILPEFKSNLDIVFIGRSRIIDSDFASLYKSIHKGFQNAGLIIED